MHEQPRKTPAEVFSSDLMVDTLSDYFGTRKYRELKIGETIEEGDIVYYSSKLRVLEDDDRSVKGKHSYWYLHKPMFRPI